MSDETKTCPYCAKTIRPAVIVCLFLFTYGCNSPESEVTKTSRAVGSATPPGYVSRLPIPTPSTESPRIHALRTAKNLTIALLMYATDNDDRLPPPSVSLRTVLTKYDPSSDLFEPKDSTIYTPPRSFKINDIDNPDSYVLICKTAVGGRAYGYLDGHAKWVDDGLIVTNKTYQAIQEGQSFDAVIKMIGHEGKEVGSSSLGDISTKTFVWNNPNGSSLTAIFQNGKLIAKSQSGLK